MKWTYCIRQAEQKCSCGQQLGLLFLLVLLVLSVAWTGRKDQLLVYQTHTVTSENETFMLEGDMPAGATVKAEKIGSGIYDLSILDVNGQEYQPGEHPVKVTIVQKTACRVYHLEETGWFELDTQLTEQGLSFQAVHFSLYAITMDAMLLSSDEMEEAVLSGTEVPIYFSWNGQTYDAQTFGSMLQTSIPLSVKSGHIEEHLDHLSQVLQGGCLDEQTLSEEPIVGAWLEGASGELLMQVHQVFSVRGHVFYDPSELREEDYIGEEETVSAVRYSLASEISGRNYELQSGERIVLKLAVTSQTVQVSEMTERSIHSVLGSGMADASLTLGSDLTILVKDAQTDESVQASFVLLSMEGEQLWSSSSVASQHTIDSGAVNFQAGETYILRQTQTANGYSCPGFDWTLTVGDDNVISGTSQTQEGSGKARSLGLQSVNGCFEVRNEQTPTLILHLQDRWDEQGETLKTLNLLAGDLDTTYTGMETRASYWFLGWSSSAQSLTVQTPAQVDTGAGVVNHLYAVWEQKLCVVFKTYSYGDYEHAIAVEGVEQDVSTSLPTGMNLLETAYRTTCLDLSMFTSDYDFGFAALQSCEDIPLLAIRKAEDAAHACIVWICETEESEEASQVETGDTLVFYECRSEVTIPIHLFEWTTDGTYVLRDTWKAANCVDLVTLQLSDSYSLLNAKACLASTQSAQLEYLSIWLGNLSEEGFEEIVQYSNQGDMSYVGRRTGILLGTEQVTSFSAQTIIAVVYYPRFRDVTVHILEQCIDGSILNRDEIWRKTNVISVSAKSTSMIQNSSVTALLLDDIQQKAAFLGGYTGTSEASLSETKVTKLKNTSFGIQINGGDTYLGAGEDLYLIFYENPRTWQVHVCEYLTAYALRDATDQWDVQTIEIPKEGVSVSSLDPRGTASDEYVLGEVKIAKGFAQLSSSASKQITELINTKNGIRYVPKGGSEAKLGTNEIFFTFYRKIRSMPVGYFLVRNGILVPIATASLDLGETGHAIASLAISNETYTDQSAIRQPNYAVLGGDGMLTYHPYVRYATGEQGMTMLSALTTNMEMPVFQNAMVQFLKKNDPSASVSYIGLDNMLYVILDDTLDNAPAYMHLCNNAEEETCTFSITLDSGTYTGPILREAAWAGKYISASGGAYSITLDPGESLKFYIPEGAGITYSVRILNGEGIEMTGEDEDFEISGALSGNLVSGPPYYWYASDSNVYLTLSSSDEQTVISIADHEEILVPAPTGRREYLLYWGVLFVASLLLMATSCLTKKEHSF